MKVYIVEYHHASTGAVGFERLGIYVDHWLATVRVAEQREWVIDYHGPHYPVKWSMAEGVNDEWHCTGGERIRIVTEELVGA